MAPKIFPGDDALVMRVADEVFDEAFGPFLRLVQGRAILRTLS
ncbi:hypothetical protein [Mesorhizobium sp. M0571]